MKTFCAVCALALSATAVTAQETGSTSIGFGFSSLGANLEAQYKVNPSYAVRGVFMGGISADYEESDEDGDYDGSIDLGGVAVMGDFYPTQGGWRISGGLLFSNNELSATGTVDVAGTDEAATITAKFENEISPIVTTGYEWAFADGWKFTPEAGIIFNGGIDLQFDATNPLAQDDIDNDPDLQDARDDASDIVVLPYVALTVSYQF